MVRQTFDSLLEDLKTSFKKTAERGQTYVVQLDGVKSFRNQGRRFMGLLQKIVGVSSVKQKAFAGGKLVVDVACKCSSSELQDRIFTATEGDGALNSLDVEDVSGKRISFKL